MEMPISAKLNAVAQDNFIRLFQGIAYFGVASLKHNRFQECFLKILTDLPK